MTNQMTSLSLTQLGYAWKVDYYYALFIEFWGAKLKFVNFFI